jgi:hypothetical protein
MILNNSKGLPNKSNFFTIPSTFDHGFAKSGGKRKPSLVYVIISGKKIAMVKGIFRFSVGAGSPKPPGGTDALAAAASARQH